MIKKILTYYANRLDEYLSKLYHQSEDMAKVGFIGNSVKMKPNKMVMSLISIERETADSTSAPVQQTTERIRQLVIDVEDVNRRFY